MKIMTKKVTIQITEITKETPKAIQIKSPELLNVGIWLPKFRVTVDGQTITMTQKLFDEKLADAKSALEVKAAGGIGNVLVDLPQTPSWESEKALGFDVEAQFLGDDAQTKRIRLFVPKSQVVDNKVKTWVLESAARRTIDNLTSSFIRQVQNGAFVFNGDLEGFVRVAIYGHIG
jgi:hypothetical protein